MAATGAGASSWESRSRKLDGWFLHRLRAQANRGAPATLRTAEDLRQETLAIVLERLREGRLEDGPGSSLDRYLWGVAKNVLRRALELGRQGIPSPPTRQEDPLARAIGTLDEPLDRLVENEEVMRVGRLLEPDLLEAVALVHRYELSDAARFLRVSSTLILARLARAARVRRHHDAGQPLSRLPTPGELALLDPHQRKRRVYDCTCCDAEIVSVLGTSAAAVRQWRAYHGLPAWPLHEPPVQAPAG